MAGRVKCFGVLEVHESFRHSSMKSGGGFVSADYALKASDRRSVSGGVRTFGGARVNWLSRTQECVTPSIAGGLCGALAKGIKAMCMRHV